MNICNLTGKFINIFYDYYKYMNLDKVINVTSINREHIVLDKSMKIYAIKLEGYSNYQENLSGIEQIRSAFMFRDENTRMMVSIIKKDTFQGSYLFCTSRDMSLSFQEMFGVEELSGDEILNALFDSYLINDYYINDEMRPASTISTKIDKDFFSKELEIDTSKPLVPLETDLLYYKGKEIIKEAVSSLMENYICYQGYRFKQKEKITFAKLYKASWRGVIYMYFDLSYNNVLAQAKLQKIQTRDEGGTAHEYAKKLEAAIENKDLSACLANCVALIENKKDLPLISNELGIEFVRKTIGVSDILGKTLLLSRDPSKNSIIRTEDIEKFIAKVHKKDSISENEGRKIGIDFYGKDLNGADVNYVFRENTNPHTLLTAPSGSGKSFGVQKVVTQFVDYDVVEKISKKIEEKQIRYFDVDFSAQKLINSMKINHGDIIDEIAPSLTEMRFNLLDIQKADNGIGLDIDDIAFKFTIFDLALESNGSEKLKADEYALMKEGTSHLYEENEYARVSICEIREDGFIELAETLLNLGYGEYSNIDAIKPEHSHLVDGIKKPTLVELESLLTTQSKDLSLSQAKKETYDNTLKKVAAINALEIFSKYSVKSFKANNMVYFDVGKIKGDPRVFAPIYMYVLMSYYSYDKEQALDIRLGRKERKFSSIPQSLYIIEESHNFMRYESFRRAFDILAREARKHGVHLFFITQNITDIPIETILSISTRIYMAEADKKNDSINAIKKHLGISKELEWCFQHLQPYQMLIDYDKGVFGCKLEISKEEAEIFSTSA